MKTIKNFFENWKNQFNSLSANYKLVVINVTAGLAGILRGVQLLIAANSAGWWKNLIHQDSIQAQITKGWILISLGVIAAGLATFFYLKEEKKYKKIQNTIQEAINNINKKNAVDTEAIPV